MLQQEKERKKLAEVDVRCFTRPVTDFPFCSTYCRNIKFSCQVVDQEEATVGGKLHDVSETEDKDSPLWPVAAFQWGIKSQPDVTVPENEGYAFFFYF